MDTWVPGLGDQVQPFADKEYRRDKLATGGACGV